MGDGGEIEGMAKGCFVKILMHQEEGEGNEVSLGSFGDVRCGGEVIFQAVGILQDFGGGVLEERVEFCDDCGEGSHGGIAVIGLRVEA